MLLYGWHYQYCPVSYCTSSVKTSVKVHWIYEMSPYGCHNGYWPVCESRTNRDDKSEWAMDIHHVAVLLALSLLALV